MRLRNYVLLFMMIFILSSCSNTESEIEGISKKYYDTFVDGYKLYEERMQKHNGQFVDSNGEAIDFFHIGIFENSDITEVAEEDMRRIEAGKDTVLTEKEIQLREDFLTLYFLNGLNYLFPDDMKKSIIEMNPEYADPIEATIELEKKIIDTLKLDKESITESLQTETKWSGIYTSEAAEETAINEYSVAYVLADAIDNGEYYEREYESEYMNPNELESCVKSEVYTKEECIDIKHLYQL